jgi:hypothetical protein
VKVCSRQPHIFSVAAVSHQPIWGPQSLFPNPSNGNAPQVSFGKKQHRCVTSGIESPYHQIMLDCQAGGIFGYPSHRALEAWREIPEMARRRTVAAYERATFRESILDPCEGKLVKGVKASKSPNDTSREAEESCCL